MNNISGSNSKTWAAGIAASAAASLCCIVPVIALLGGASGAASSFSWVEPYRPYLIGLSVLVFGFAWYRQLKPKKAMDCCSKEKVKPSFVQGRTFLGIVTLIAALLMAFPYYASIFYQKAEAKQVVFSSKADIKKAVFHIKGMSCESCTEHVNRELSGVSGVLDFTTSYEDANSVVDYDSRKVNTDSIISAINKTGYLATLVEPK